MLNLRYGYNWFVRGTDSNPANHGFDLTSLGFPASYNSSIPDDIRRFPRFDITGYQGTGIGGEERPNETHSFIATLNKSTGAHSLKTGMEFRQYRETDRVLRQQPDRPVQLRRDLDARTARQLAGRARISLGQSFASFLLGLPSSGSVARAASYDETSHDLGLLRAGRLARRLAPDAEPRPALRVRDAADRGRQPQRARLRRRPPCRPIEAAARARYALNPTPEVPASAFNVRGGLTFAGVDGQPSGLYETPKNNFMPRVGADLQAERPDRRCAAATACSTGSSASAAATSSRAASAQTTNLVPSLDNGLTFIETLSNPFPNGIQEPRRQRAGHRDVPRPEHHVLRSQSEVAADAALAGRHPARAAGRDGSPRPATSATTARSCRRRATSTRRRTST